MDLTTSNSLARFGYLIFAILLAFSIFGRVKADPPIFNPSVYISEVAWAGSILSGEAKTADEWVELTNNTDKDIDLSGWKISYLSGGLEKDMVNVVSGSIPASGNFLIANYAPPDTVLPFNADIVSTAVSLANTKLQLKLYNNFGELIDTVDDGDNPLTSNQPPYGDNTTKASMERLLPLADGTLATSWQTSTTPIDLANPSNNFGTPKVAGYPVLTVDQTKIFKQSSTSTSLVSGKVSSAAYSADQLSVQIVCDLTLDIMPDTTGIFTSQINVGTKTDYCLVNASDPRGVKSSKQLDITVLPSVGKIIISEAVSNPAEGQDEFIELENLTNTPIDLSGWQLDDISGGSKPYLFPIGSSLPPGFKAYYKISTGIILNNDGDEARLLDPTGAIYTKATIPTLDQGEAWVWLQGIYQTNSAPTPGLETVPIVYSSELALNEVLPNPIGSDEENEYLELYNSSQENINLTGWKIADDTGSKKYTFPVSSMIAGQSYLAIYNSQSKISLLNNGGNLSLVDPSGEIKSQIKWEKMISGRALARSESGSYEPTDSPTPGLKNIFTLNIPISSPSLSQSQETSVETVSISQIDSPLPSVDTALVEQSAPPTKKIIINRSVSIKLASTEKIVYTPIGEVFATRNISVSPSRISPVGQHNVPWWLGIIMLVLVTGVIQCQAYLSMISRLLSQRSQLAIKKGSSSPP